MNEFEVGLNAVFDHTPSLQEPVVNTAGSGSFHVFSPEKVKKSTGKSSSKKTNFGEGKTLQIVEVDVKPKKRFRDEDRSDPRLDAVQPETAE